MKIWEELVKLEQFEEAKSIVSKIRILEELDDKLGYAQTITLTKARIDAMGEDLQKFIKGRLEELTKELDKI